MGKQMKWLFVIAIAVMLVVANIGGIYAAPWGYGDRRAPSPQQRPQQRVSANYSSVSLSSSTPAENGTLSTSNATIVLQFSGDITYSTSQSGEAILLLKGLRSRVPISVTAAGTSGLIITPNGALNQNAKYTLYVYGLNDSSGLVIKPFTLSFSAATNADAANTASTPNTGNNSSQPTQFKDVGSNFWGYQAIADLNKRGIINGYSDGTFKPNESVTRSQFASMLTKALNLTATDNTQTFADVAPSSWDYSAVQAAKSYLTGYKTSNGTMYFYGSNNAVREDMSVALVKALNLTVQSNDSELQQTFTDYNDISADLRDYVYTAYKDNIMQGSNNAFNPQGTLTRAEAAVLLERALNKVEKVAVDGNSSDNGQKVVVDNSGTSSSKDTDATLSNLSYNGTTITGFNAGALTYNVTLPYGTTAVPAVTVAVTDTGKATAVVTQAAGLPGSATVVVIAEDGTTTKTYTINFAVAAPKDTDATLSDLTCNGTAVTDFAAGIFTYNIVLPEGTTEVPTVEATIHDTGKATVVVVPAASLPGTTTVLVTAEDGITINTYTINFTVSTSQG